MLGKPLEKTGMYCRRKPLKTHGKVLIETFVEIQVITPVEILIETVKTSLGEIPERTPEKISVGILEIIVESIQEESWKKLEEITQKHLRNALGYLL